MKPTASFLSYGVIIPTIIILILIAAIVYGGLEYKTLKANFEETKIRFASTTEEFEIKVKTLEDSLESQKEENIELTAELREEAERNGRLAREVKKITTTVSEIEKLRKLDKQLLEKYSKIYFLNEHYVPSSVSQLASSYVLPSDKKVMIHSSVEPFLTDMIDEAKEDAIDLRVTSGYRSFVEQTSVKSTHVMIYGAGTANQFSADQGYSEHQLGTTIDITTPSVGGAYNSFENTPAYTWMQNNAYKFGLILSYPKNNIYYQFEPWHWRFVGTDLARTLHRDKLNFYDVDQRELSEHLINIFD